MLEGYDLYPSVVFVAIKDPNTSDDKPSYNIESFFSSDILKEYMGKKDFEKMRKRLLSEQSRQKHHEKKLEK